MYGAFYQPDPTNTSSLNYLLNTAIKLEEGHYVMRQHERLIYEVVDYNTPQVIFTKKLYLTPEEMNQYSSRRNSTLKYYLFNMDKDEVSIFESAIRKEQKSSLTKSI